MTTTYKKGDPWFEDGNVMLLTDTDVMMPVGFKVHRGALARQSEVFCDMFDIPAPTLNDAGLDLQMEGCPVVHVTDHPVLLGQMLRALYDGM